MALFPHQSEQGNLSTVRNSREIQNTCSVHFYFDDIKSLHLLSVKHPRNTIPLFIFVSRNPELMDCDQKSLKPGQRTSFGLLETLFFCQFSSHAWPRHWNHGMFWVGKDPSHSMGTFPTWKLPLIKALGKPPCHFSWEGWKFNWELQQPKPQF